MLGHRGAALVPTVAYSREAIAYSPEYHSAICIFFSRRHREQASDFSAASTFCHRRHQKEYAAASHKYAATSREYAAAGTNAAPRCPNMKVDG
ncbi:hypothetical protein AXF42_Ash020448 [Apostasia shenzhenica]|uniref:Uncharacterized protein n=1 Tax=Apostasia shenzhenica TaxID=1088818 RepID=A0A2H9ZYJ9_9ASPA|nr:hypothetical protein AXF42_Ash020448 [Apostasia shenzhenica]